MSAWRLALVGLASLAGCDRGETGTAGRAIVGGALDEGDPAVAAIGARRHACDEAFVAECTGVLVAPRVVLTAAHCLDRGERGLEVAFGTHVAQAGDSYVVIDTRVHPAYDDATDRHDVALLLLDRAPPVTPLPLATTPLDPARLGDTIRIVGFGVSGDGGTGEKRSGTARLTAIADPTFTIEPAPALTCAGDSGGPALLDLGSGEVVVGTAVSGDVACAANGLYADVGAYADAFVAPFVAETEGVPPLGDDGPIGQGVTCVPCETGACPPGFECEPQLDGEARCAAPSHAAAELGEVCSSQDDCRGGDCVRLSGGCRCAHACAEVPLPPNPPEGCDCRASGGRSTGPRAVLGLLVCAAIGIASRRKRRMRPRG